MVKGKKKKVHRLLSAVAAAMIALAGISNAQVSAGNNKADALTAEETAKLADVSKTAVLQEDGSYKINLSVTGRELEKESLLKRKEIMNTDVILLIDVSRSMTEYVQLNIPGVPNERRWTILQRVLGSKDEGLVYDILSGAVQDDGTVKESGNKVRFVFFGGSKDQTVIDYKVVDNNGQGYTINEIEQAVSTYAADVETTATSLLGSMRQITNTADGIRGAVKAVESARAAEPGRNTRVFFLQTGILHSDMDWSQLRRYAVKISRMTDIGVNPRRRHLWMRTATQRPLMNGLLWK